jgi:predicted transcriptional regulator
MSPEQLRAARINAGFSIRGLGRHLSVPEQSIRRLESGLSVTPENAKKVADFHGIQVMDLEPFSDAA